MGRMKIERNEEQDVKYSPDRWDLLHSLRKNALAITSIFHAQDLESLTYGSIARGDVKPSSDIDIILTTQIASFRVELMLEQSKIQILQKKIVQATPNDIIKGNFELPNEICLTLPLTDFTSMPYEFYRFGGAVSYEQLAADVRVPGADKRLMLIEPTANGHHESSIADRPQDAARIIGVSSAMVEQRIRVLSRRDEVGRTGVFLNQSIPLEQNFEDALRELANGNQMIRRRLRI